MVRAHVGRAYLVPRGILYHQSFTRHEEAAGERKGCFVAGTIETRGCDPSGRSFNDVPPVDPIDEGELKAAFLTA